MIKFRTKYWFLLCGANLLLAITLVFSGHWYGLLSAGLAVFSWYYAHWLLEKDAEELMKKIEGEK